MGRTAERLKRERSELASLIADGGMKTTIQEIWCERTLEHKSTFYSRLRELPDELQRRFKTLPDGRDMDRSTYYELLHHAKYWDSTKRELEDLLKSKPEFFGHRFNLYYRSLPKSVRAPIEERSKDSTGVGPSLANVPLPARAPKARHKPANPSGEETA
jgi:hypothetical protein